MDYPSLQPFPPQIATLVGEIESVIGKPIEIRTRDAAYNPLMAPEELAMCDCHMINGSMNVSILLPNEKSTPMHTLFHELLHAHRNVCLSIPRLTPIKDSAAGFRLTSS
ncbi:hypothetical protein O0882_15090, partial [Janthinobacterium sp. SUN073]|uniref:hypothetical protein n=1 Tax=Janthinobacterium sp. SUN073 TaxID=3004102 RepID=UPI0025B016B0